MLSRKLDTAIKNANLDDHEVAHALNVTPTDVRSWRSGKSIYSVHQLIQLCDLLHCSADYLLCREITIANWRDKLR